VSDVLVTDLYEVTMALNYRRLAMAGPATFSLFVRDLPPDRGFLVAAGLESVLDYLADFCVEDDDVTALADALDRPPSDLEPLRALRFTGDVWAVPEGRVVLQGEPLLEVTAPLPEAQLVETYVLNQVSHQTALASKAARSVLAASGRPVVDFGLRRCQGVEAGMHAARAAAIVGFASTSNVAGALRYGLPATGTMAHSFVEVFPDEAGAFRAFATGGTDPVTLLVDTYDTGHGLEVAADVLREVTDGRSRGVRLDSGDLLALAHTARRTLDAAGLDSARVVVSGGLDEFAVDDLVAAGAPVDVFAVGTRVATSADAPYLDAAYKLVEYDGRPVMKLSTGKVTAPGAKQVHRREGAEDVLATRSEPVPPGYEALLDPVMRGGRRTTAAGTPASAVAEARERFARDLALLPAEARRIRTPVAPRPRTSARLAELTADVVQALRGQGAAEATVSRDHGGPGDGEGRRRGT
jgi:nicotinate phosphoribosyltransferase